MTQAESQPAEKEQKLDTSSNTIMMDVIEVMDTCIEQVENNLDTSNYDVPALIKHCLRGLEDVAIHFYHHFKSIYRLAHYYYNSTKHKDILLVEKLLLAGEKDKNVQYPGLFFGRKANQVFNEIWRIPITEIDRPGSFASHCAKGLLLLIEVLRNLPDLNTLADIVLQLRKPPAEENKFIHESDRLEIGVMASTFLFNTIKSQTNSVCVEKETSKPTLIVDIYRIYQKLLKQWSGKEKEVMVSLKELYSKIKKKQETDKISNEEVLRFCAAEARGKTIRQNQPAYAAAKTMSATSLTSNVTSNSTKSFAENSVVNSKSSNFSNLSSNDRTGIVKDLSHMSAYIQKICECINMFALNIPNMTTKQVLGFNGLDSGEHASSVVVLFQNLCQLSRADLNAIGLDKTQITSLNMFATKVGANMSSVNNHIFRLNSILNGTAKVGQVSTNTPSLQSVNGMLGKSNTVEKSGSLNTSHKSSLSASDTATISVVKASTPTIKAVFASKDTNKKPATLAQISKTTEKAVIKQTSNPSIAIKKTGSLISKNNSKDYFAAIKKGYADQGLKINDEILMQTQNVFDHANRLANPNQIKQTSLKKHTPQLKQIRDQGKIEVTNSKSVKQASSPQTTVIANTSIACSSAVNPSLAAQQRIMNLPSSVTLTHVPSQTGKTNSRSASPALARVGNASNPGSRSNSPQSVPNTNMKGAPAAIVGNKKNIVPASVIKSSSTTVEKSKAEYEKFKTKVMRLSKNSM